MSEYTPKTDKLWDDSFPAALKMSPINRCVFFFELLEKMRDHAREMEEDSFKWKCAAEAWEKCATCKPMEGLRQMIRCPECEEHLMRD